MGASSCLLPHFEILIHETDTWERTPPPLRECQPPLQFLINQKGVKISNALGPLYSCDCS